MMLWILGGIVGVAAIGALALQVAIARDGPGVLSVVDRASGGTVDAQRLTVASTGENSQQKVIVWGPAPNPDAAKRPVLVFVHGGSWRTGDPESYDFIGRAFVPKGFVVVVVGYRLGDDGKFPAMLEDTASAIAWTHREIAKFGGDRQKIVVAGHSAGAYNVAMTALEPRWLEREKLSPAVISGVIGLAGPYDFYPFDSDSTKAAFGDAPDPEATQPVTYVRGDAPPMLLIHGEKDDTVKIRNTRELARLIEAAGGTVSTRIYPDMEHSDPLIALAAPWRGRRDTADIIVDFARSVTAAPADTETVSVPVQEKTA